MAGLSSQCITVFTTLVSTVEKEAQRRLGEDSVAVFCVGSSVVCASKCGGGERLVWCVYVCM